MWEDILAPAKEGPANSATLRCGVQDAVRAGSSSSVPSEIARSRRACSLASSRVAASRALSSSRSLVSTATIASRFPSTDTDAFCTQSLASTATIAASNSPSTDTGAFCTHNRRARAAVAHSSHRKRGTMQAGREDTITGRVRVERGIYRQRGGRYAVCFMATGKPRFRTVGEDLTAPHGEDAETRRHAAGFRWS
jgi:hypothetical protein